MIGQACKGVKMDRAPSMHKIILFTFLTFLLPRLWLTHSCIVSDGGGVLSETRWDQWDWNQNQPAQICHWQTDSPFTLKSLIYSKINMDIRVDSRYTSRSLQSTYPCSTHLQLKHFLTRAVRPCIQADPCSNADVESIIWDPLELILNTLILLNRCLWVSCKCKIFYIL